MLRFLKIWEVETSRCLFTSKAFVYILATSLKHYAVYNASGNFSIWNIEKNESIFEYLDIDAFSIFACWFSSNDDFVALCCIDNIVKLVNLKTGTLINQFVHENYFNSCAITPNDKFVLTGTYDGIIRIWKIEDASYKEYELLND